MKKHINEIMSELTELNIRLKQIMKDTHYDEYEDLSELELDKTDAEQLFLHDELRQLMSKIADISHTLSYLRSPVKHEGILSKKSNGRYEFDGIELTSGCGIEFLATDEWHCDENWVPVPYWCYGTLEHNGSDYYIQGANLETLEGVRVRIRY